MDDDGMDAIGTWISNLPTCVRKLQGHSQGGARGARSTPIYLSQVQNTNKCI